MTIDLRHGYVTARAASTEHPFRRALPRRRCSRLHDPSGSSVGKGVRHVIPNGLVVSSALSNWETVWLTTRYRGPCSNAWARRAGRRKRGRDAFVLVGPAKCVAACSRGLCMTDDAREIDVRAVPHHIGQLLSDFVWNGRRLGDRRDYHVAYVFRAPGELTRDQYNGLEPVSHLAYYEKMLPAAIERGDFEVDVGDGTRAFAIPQAIPPNVRSWTDLPLLASGVH